MARRYDWWDVTWNPVGGCEYHSPGCKFCYAAKQAGTLHHEAGAERRIVPLYAGTVDRTKVGYAFNGTLTALPAGHKGWSWPLQFRGAEHPLLGPGQPTLVFIADMSDLFHPGRPKSVIDRTLGTMTVSPHIGLVLTKRPDRLAEYLAAAQLSASALERWQAHLWLG